MPQLCERIIEQERPNALVPTVGRQTALNLALARHNIELIGANLESIRLAEDRQLFKDAMTEIGLRSPRSAVRGCSSRTGMVYNQNIAGIEAAQGL